MEPYTFLSLAREINCKEKAIQFLQSKGILHEQRFCKKKHEMHLVLHQKNDRWVCKKQKCRVEVGLRKNTWLENTILSFETIVIFIYCWSKEYTSTKFCMNELGMASESITNWKNYLREVCADHLLKNPKTIGGEGLTVEIDESSFSRRKYNRGRVLPNQWVFGGICRETRECFMYAVPDRTRATLLSTVTACIQKGSTIISDEWKAYSSIPTLEGYNFKHYTVNHSENFVDPTTGAHTQNIENLWTCAKMRNKREKGTRRELLDSYLCEFLWRHRHKDQDLFEAILHHIKDFQDTSSTVNVY